MPVREGKHIIGVQLGMDKKIKTDARKCGILGAMLILALPKIFELIVLKQCQGN